MPVYMVDRNLPGITMEQLAAAQKAVIEAGKRTPPPASRYVTYGVLSCRRSRTACVYSKRLTLIWSSNSTTRRRFPIRVLSKPPI